MKTEEEIKALEDELQQVAEWLAEYEVPDDIMEYGLRRDAFDSDEEFDEAFSQLGAEIALEIVDSRSDLATKEELEFIESKIKEMMND